MPSKLDLTFAKYALENDLLSSQVCQNALDEIEKARQKDEKLTLPDLLVDKNAISKKVAVAVLKVVERKDQIKFAPRPKPTRQDLIFARLVLANKLLEKEKVEECLREISKREQYNDVAFILEQKGYLSREVIEKIFKAWQKRKEEIEKEREAQERLQEMVKREQQSESFVDAAVRKYLRSFLHLRVLSYLEERKGSAVDPKAIADFVGVSEKDVRSVIPVLIRNNLLKSITPTTHQYAPGPKNVVEIREVMRWLRDEKKRKQLMGKVTAQGQSS